MSNNTYTCKLSDLVEEGSADNILLKIPNPVLTAMPWQEGDRLKIRIDHSAGTVEITKAD
jgi:hypothetical protein